jgi:P-type conjugative transfer protein TrbJ
MILIILLPVVSFAIYPVQDNMAISTQIANGAKIVTSIANEGMMINNQVQMLKGIASDGFHVSDFRGNLSKIQDISQRGQAMSYASKNIDQKFDQLFGNKGDDALKKQNNADQSLLDTALATFKTASENINYTQEEAGGIAQITNSSNSEQGLRGVMQGTNQLLNANAAQMQNLSAMQAQENTLHATKAAAQAAKQKAANKQDATFLHYTPTYKPYQGDPELATIPDFN